jgi:UDP-glucose 4-epimerase
VTFIEGDLGDEEKLPGWLQGHDIVIHLAALVPVSPSVSRPVAYAYNNVVNTVRMLEGMRSSGVRRIVFSSSATVYGTPERLPIVEDDPVRSQSNPYGATKVAAEAFMAVYHNLHGFDVTILRYFNPYGPNELCEPETHAVPNIVRAALEDRPIPVYWQGTQIRDFIYVEDLARAHVAVLALVGMNIFNVGTGNGVSINEVLDAIRGILKRPLKIDDLGERPGDVPATYASHAKITEVTGWRGEVGLVEGLRRTIEFYQGRMK